MTTTELIPVLKALHHDHRCAPFLADWFEERDELGVAEALRFGVFTSGPHLIRQFVWGGVVDAVEDAPFHGFDISRSLLFEQAVIEEAWSRINWYELGNNHEWLDQDLRYHRDTVFIRGTRGPWHRIPHQPSWSWDRSQQYTCVSPDGEKATRIMMRLVPLKWEPPVVPLCGSILEVTLSVWAGRDPFTNRPIVTHYEKSLARDPVLRELPF